MGKKRAFLSRDKTGRGSYYVEGILGQMVFTGEEKPAKGGKIVLGLSGHDRGKRQRGRGRRTYNEDLRNRRKGKKKGGMLSVPPETRGREGSGGGVLFKGGGKRKNS